MTQAASHQALVIMFAMRPPDFFASQSAFYQGDGGIDDKRRKYEQGKPRGPAAIHPSQHTQCRSKEPERNRARISHENACRMKIKQQKSRCCCGNAEVGNCKGLVSGNPCCRSI